jgi:hypothetical protein
VVEALRSSFREPPVAPRRTVAEVGLVAVGSSSHRRSASGGGLIGLGWIAPRVGLGARALVTRGQAVASDHGEARIDAFSIGVGPVFSPFADHETAGLRIEALAQVTGARPAGEAGPGARSQAATVATVELSAGVSAWLRSGPLAFSAGLAISYPLRAVRATDEQQVTTAIEGPAGVLSIAVFLVR